MSMSLNTIQRVKGALGKPFAPSASQTKWQQFHKSHNHHKLNMVLDDTSSAFMLTSHPSAVLNLN